MDPVDDASTEDHPERIPEPKRGETGEGDPREDLGSEQTWHEPEVAPDPPEAGAESRKAGGCDNTESPGQGGGDSTTVIGITNNRMDGHGFEIIGQKYENYYQAVERLEIKDFVRLSADDLENEVRGVHIDDSVLEAGLRCLSDQRILCVEGQPEVGKGTFACYLAWTLICDGRAHGARIHRGLARQVKVRLAQLLERLADFDSNAQVLVVEDALSGANRDLVAWLANLSEGEVGHLSTKLQRMGFLILTSDSELWAPYADNLKRLGLLVPLPEPNYAVLRQVVMFEIERVRQGRDDLRKRAERLLDEHRERIHAVLRTLPRARRFTRRHLLDLLEDDAADDLDAALDRFDDAGSDLVSVLSDDLEAGCGLLALAVAHLEPWQDGVDWSLFERLRRELCRRLRRRLHREAETLNAGDLLTPYARDLGIEFLHGASSDGDRVRFQDRLYGERIWRTFRTSGRGVAALLLPELLELARSGDDWTRPVAAKALGRLGQASPGSLVVPLVETWMEAEEDRLNESLAQLLRGAALAGDQGYLEHCLYRLGRSLDRSTDERKAVAFGRALREVGFVALDTAVEHLMAVLRHGSLHEKLEDMGIFKRRIRSVRDDTAGGRGDREAMVIAVLSQTFGVAESNRLLAVKYALVGLCFGLGPPACLAALSPYLEDDDRAVARLLTLQLLSPRGLLDFLQSFRERLELENGQASPPIPCLLAGIYGSERGAHQMAAVFDELFAIARDFPNPLGNYLRRRPLQLVRKWCEELEKVPALESDLGTLLHLLLNSRHEEQCQATFGMLQREDLFVRQGTPLEALGHEVLSRPAPDGDGAVTK